MPRAPKVSGPSLDQFAEIIGSTLEWTYQHSDVKAARRFTVSIRSVDLVEGSTLVGAYGEGNTPEKALKNYAGRLAGKKIKVDGRYYSVPTTLVA